MQIQQLKAFIAISEFGSFSVAAESLFITQPAMSKRIASLESFYDAKLFDRMGKRTHMTEAGYLLLPKAKKIISELTESRQMIADMHNAIRGRLSIATSHHIGLRRLPDHLKVFKARHPDVSLDFHFMDSEEACKLVAEGSIEMGIVTLPLHADKSLTKVSLWKDRLIPCCSKNHGLTKTKHLQLEQLCEYDAILPGRETFTRQIVDQYLHKTACRPTIAMETNYLETLSMMASVGIGWTVLPEIMITGDMRPLKIERWDINRSLGLIHDNKRTLSNAAIAMKQLLIESS